MVYIGNMARWLLHHQCSVYPLSTSTKYIQRHHRSIGTILHQNTQSQYHYSHHQYSTKHITTAAVANNNTSNSDTIPLGCLTRQFIDYSLYNHQNGYFNNQQRIINTINKINWSTVTSKQQYIKILDALYSSSDTAWLTPVELYQPYYGYTICNWLLEKYLGECHIYTNQLSQLSQLSPDKFKPFNIIEIGGGTGTLCCNVLDYIQNTYPCIYDQIQYTIIDYSVRLHKLQHTALYKHINNNRVILQNKSAVDITAPDNVHSSVNCVIGIEVLDNMSHDKLIQRNNQLYQTHVYQHGIQPSHKLHNTIQYNTNTDLSLDYYEIYDNVHDPAIVDWLNLTIDYNDKYEENRYYHTLKQKNFDQHAALYISSLGDQLTNKIMNHTTDDTLTQYIPTTALQFLQALIRHIPSHHILLGDFYYLPNTIVGQNAPIVSSKQNGQTIDESTYLSNLGKSDIFFPTNFQQLLYVYNKLIQQQHTNTNNTSIQHPNNNKQSIGTVYSNYEFMKKYAKDDNNIVINSMFGYKSYRPMNEDYINFRYISI